ncbi:hypothetical protein RQP53_13640 [Paucibacter sp. APW11]|uniref:Uncharacterized protein n=1 Tax=Roseateles aquae TaxID=3077235 RepID=A0ABU3PCK4_9BURK|nr:hypothetical protein [Paucibacter sp. APW11]MDT9000311.1 hypothetical protein [Paucibacter sp. APW11]
MPVFLTSDELSQLTTMLNTAVASTETNQNFGRAGRLTRATLQMQPFLACEAVAQKGRAAVERQVAPVTNLAYVSDADAA